MGRYTEQSGPNPMNMGTVVTRSLTTLNFSCFKVGMNINSCTASPDAVFSLRSSCTKAHSAEVSFWASKRHGGGNIDHVMIKNK